MAVVGSPATLFSAVKVFDGPADRPSDPSDVLVQDGTVAGVTPRGRRWTSRSAGSGSTAWPDTVHAYPARAVQQATRRGPAEWQPRPTPSCALSRRRSPYSGQLGVLREGALADLPLVDGDPLQDLSLLATPDTSLDVIMNDDRLYKGPKVAADGEPSEGMECTGMGRG